MLETATSRTFCIYDNCGDCHKTSFLKCQIERTQVTALSVCDLCSNSSHHLFPQCFEINRLRFLRLDSTMQPLHALESNHTIAEPLRVTNTRHDCLGNRCLHKIGRSVRSCFPIGDITSH